MADVTGSIGNEYVELNNAATEATLKLLLQATLSANKQTIDQIKAMAKSSGIDPDTVEQVNQSNSRLAASGTKLGAAYGALSGVADQVAGSFRAVSKSVEEIVSGTGNISGTLGELGKLPGVLGLVFTGMSKLVGYQEELLKTYQTLTNSGVNFGGSLTDMRLSAAKTYMTLTEFSNVIKNNTDALSMMGGSVNDGAKAFVKLSNNLLADKTGNDLRALGYTTEQVNQGLLTYINMTGGRNRQELKNTADITKSAAEYMTQLDGLAQLTGKSREQQEKALKEANQNAAIQAKLATMDEKQKAAYNRGLAEMEAKFGKAGVEMYQAQVLGIPPMTEAAQKLTALAPEVSRASQGMADVAKRGGDAAETMRYSAQATEGAIKASDNFSNIAGAMSFQTGSTSEAMMGLTKAATLARQQGRETEAKDLEARAKIIEEQKKRQESEAAQAVKTQQAVQELGQEMLNKLLPIVKSLWGVINPLITTVTTLVTAMLKIPYLFETLGVMLAAVTALYAAHKVKLAVGSVRDTVGGLFGGGGGRGGPPIPPTIPGGGGAGGAGGATGALGGLGNVLQQIGPTIKSLGTGFGGAIKAIFRGIAGGLAAFANPIVLLGAAGFGVAIAAIGAGIAGATWLLGKALPSLAEGMKAFEQLNGERLISAGKGIGALGLGLAAFGASSGIAAVGNLLGGLVEKFGSFLGVKSPTQKIKEFADMGPGLEKAGNGIKNFNTQLVLLLNTDLSRTKEVVNSLNQLKAAAPGSGGLFSKIGEGLTSLLPKSKNESSSPPMTDSAMSKFNNIFSKNDNVSNTTLPKTAEVKNTLAPSVTIPNAPISPIGNTVQKTSAPSGKAMESLVTELQTLNKQSLEMLKYLKETAEYSRKNVDAVRGLNGDMFKF